MSTQIQRQISFQPSCQRWEFPHILLGLTHQLPEMLSLMLMFFYQDKSKEVMYFENWHNTDRVVLISRAVDHNPRPLTHLVVSLQNWIVFQTQTEFNHHNKNLHDHESQMGITHRRMINTQLIYSIIHCHTDEWYHMSPYELITSA